MSLGTMSKLQPRDQDPVDVQASSEIDLLVFHCLDTTCNSDNIKCQAVEIHKL